MNDRDFFDGLTQAWQRDTLALEVSRRKAQRRLWTNRVLFAAEFLYSIAGLWIAWYFWQRGGLLHTVSAGVLLAAIALSVWVSLRERLPLWHWHDWSPEGVLRYRMRLCESALRYARWCRLSSAVLLPFMLYIWISALLEPASMPAYFPALYTGAIFLTVAGLEWWAARQRKLRNHELEELRALLQDFAGSQ